MPTVRRKEIVSLSRAGGDAKKGTARKTLKQIRISKANKEFLMYEAERERERETVRHCQKYVLIGQLPPLSL